MKIGYIRVSKDTQATLLQEDAMKREECKRVFVDKMTGKRFDRPEYLKMLDHARPGDVIVVWRLDRLGRSLKELIATVSDLAERGVELRSLKENIDTTTPTGTFMFHIMAALTEFERDLISERTLAGLEAARARGRKGGRPAVTKNMSVANLEQARALYASQKMSVTDIMKRTGFRSRTTFYKYVVNAEKHA